MQEKTMLTTKFIKSYEEILGNPEDDAYSPDGAMEYFINNICDVIIKMRDLPSLMATLTNNQKDLLRILLSKSNADNYTWYKQREIDYRDHRESIYDALYADDDKTLFWDQQKLHDRLSSWIGILTDHQYDLPQQLLSKLDDLPRAGGHDNFRFGDLRPRSGPHYGANDWGGRTPKSFYSK